ncbi:MAG: sugar ABC transporter permease [Mesorhizobium sp.]|nr:sugar ABC transporter permease [Mesorhizobium sp. M2A.F.Ca.ET.042.01.1.1]RWB73961.1 MAG: sugar ABC transporter permease [Mesorhizobium sp.]RWD69843.1 MAG: sugar ABC transporter permease [Mesorhizobium sp.]RWE74963.1 MAG: sugar ABC transporter permease [Mesorhizobium sp.]TIV26995.1 MAG: ABC transporter permease subunit [Mesorhizobium sp.]
MTVMKPGHSGEAVKIGFAGSSRFDRNWLGPLAAVWSFRWILIAFVLILWFVYYPIIDNFVVSTKNQDIFTGETAFVGLENYRRLQADPVVWTSIVNNTLYAVISVVFQVFGAFVLAALIEGLAGERWRRFWRAVYFVPSAISITVTGLLFYFIYQPDIGLLDSALTQIGLAGWSRAWLGEEQTAIYAIIAMSQWQGFGYSTLLFAIAIQKIPRDLYDAAIMDGAGTWRRLWSITFPLTREMTGLMVIITITGAFQVFNEVMVMTAGGPNNSSQVLGTWLYQQGFIENDFGYGAAIASVIFVITLMTGFAQLWYTKRRRVEL